MDTPNASFVNNATVNGSTTITDVATSTFTNNGTLVGAVTLTDSNGTRFVNTGTLTAGLVLNTTGNVTLSGTFSKVEVVQDTAINLTGTITNLEANADVELVGGTLTNAPTGSGSVSENTSEGSLLVRSETALNAALNDESVAKIKFSSDFSNVTSPIVIDRAVTIDGNGQTLAKGFEVQTGNVTIKNLTITGQGYTDNESADVAIYVSDTTEDLVTFDNVTINYAPNNGNVLVGGITAVSTSNIAVLNSKITVEDIAIATANDGSASVYTYGAIEVRGLISNSPAGIVIDNSTPNKIGVISGNTFNGAWVGVTLFNAASQEGKSKEETKANLLSTSNNNTFSSALQSGGSDWRVSLGS